MQYQKVYDFLMPRLENELPAYLTYHNAAHTKNVIAAAERMHKENSYRHPKHLERFGTEEKPGVGYAIRPYEEFVKEALAGS